MCDGTEKTGKLIYLMIGVFIRSGNNYGVDINILKNIFWGDSSVCNAYTFKSVHFKKCKLWTNSIKEHHTHTHTHTHTHKNI